MKGILDKSTIEADIEEFETWSTHSTQEESKSIEKDVRRSKMAQYHEYPQLLAKAQLVLGCYCARQNIPYQQGMHEVCYPLMVLHYCGAKLGLVYAYFKLLLNNVLPNVLQSKMTTKGLALPHVKCYLKLCALLLKYHDRELSNRLDANSVLFEGFVPPWLMTFFGRCLPLELQYELWDIVLLEHDKLFFLFLIVGFLIQRRQDILDVGDDLGLILSQLNKQMKIKTITDLSNLYYL
jgi:hypothetical protein